MATAGSVGHQLLSVGMMPVGHQLKGWTQAGGADTGGDFALPGTML